MPPPTRFRSFEHTRVDRSSGRSRNLRPSFNPPVPCLAWSFGQYVGPPSVSPPVGGEAERMCKNHRQNQGRSRETTTRARANNIFSVFRPGAPSPTCLASRVAPKLDNVQAKCVTTPGIPFDTFSPARSQMHVLGLEATVCPWTLVSADALTRFARFFRKLI